MGLLVKLTHLIVYICLTGTTRSANTAKCDTVEKQVLDCRQRNLSSIPDDIVNSSNVTTLNLYGNNIRSLGPQAFLKFPYLRFLNLSTCNLTNLDNQTFKGLDDLKVLDITNNPVINHLTNKVFRYCPNMTHLYLSGYFVLNQNIFTPLTNLEEITLTTQLSAIPHELAILPKLRVLNFAFCRHFGRLTKDMMHNLSTTHLQEIAFHVCDIKSVDNDTFDNFRNLRLLNFVGNMHLHVNDVLEMISTSKDLRIEDLIFDLVGHYNKYDPLLLGPDKHGECFPALKKYLKNLSCRGINLIGFHENLTSCLPNLETISVGFNTPVIFSGVSDKLKFAQSKLQYIDISHFMFTDDRVVQQLIGYWKHQSWVQPSKSYFPPRNYDISTNVLRFQSNKTIYQTDKCKHHVTLPKHLVYIKADHVAYIGNWKPTACLRLNRNYVRYVNVSYRLDDEAVDASHQYLYGLDNLEVLDVNDFGLTNFDINILKLFPSIKELYLKKNNLANMMTKALPFSPSLQILDLSENTIDFLRTDTFSSLPNLTQLYLRSNALQNIDFLTEDLKHLAYVDVSGNKILNISYSTIIKLEEFHVNMTLDLSDNPLQCECGQQDMVKWIQTTHMNLVNRHTLRCHSSQSADFITKVDRNKMAIHCAYNKILVSSLTSGISLLLVITFLLIYKFRWAIRWHYYKAIYLRTRRHNDYQLLESLNDDTNFSTFIIYPIDDDGIRPWVVETLRKRIEQDWQKKDCFLRGRDDIPGQWDYDNIVGGLLKSKSALWVICPEFYEDKWCQSASNFALMELGAENNAFLVMEDRFEEYSQPKHLQKLLTQQHGLRLMQYTKDNNGQNMFWSSLEQFIPI